MPTIQLSFNNYPRHKYRTQRIYLTYILEPYEALEETVLFNQKTRFIKLNLIFYRLIFLIFLVSCRERCNRTDRHFNSPLTKIVSWYLLRYCLNLITLSSLRSKDLTWGHRIIQAEVTFEHFVTPKNISLYLRYSYVLSRNAKLVVQYSIVC